MAALRKCLHWIAATLSAGFAPVRRLNLSSITKARICKPEAIGEFLPTHRVVVLAPRADGGRKTKGSRPAGGAVILAFPRRAVPQTETDEPPALTGSR